MWSVNVGFSRNPPETSGNPPLVSGFFLLIKKDLEMNVTPGPSKLEKVVEPGRGPRGPLSGSTTFSNFDGPGVYY